MSQESYSLGLTPSIAGGIAQDLESEIQTRTVPLGADPVGYGLGVEHLAGGDDYIKPFVGGALSGIVVRDLASEVADGEYPAASKVPLLTNGVIWVQVDSDVTPSDSVFIRSAVEPEVFTVTWNADFVAANKINGNVDGEAISEVTFDTDQATTIALVAAAIEALDNVESAEVTDTREITVTGVENGVALAATSSFTVTLGAGQATDTIHVESGPTNGAVLGAFRADADDVGNGDTAIPVAQGKFESSASAGGLAALRINLP